MMRRLLFVVTLFFTCLNLVAQSPSAAWKRAEHLRHGINASEWLAQSHDYSPQRLRAFTTLDDIAKMHTMGFDHVRISIVFSSRRRHTRYIGDWSSDVCSSD